MQRILKIDDHRFNRLAILGLAIAFLLQLTVVASAFLTYARNQASGQWVEHSHEVISKLSGLALAIERAETSGRGFLLSGDASRMSAFRDNIGKVPGLLDEIERLTADNPAQQRNMALLRSRVERQSGEISETLELASAGRMPEAMAEFRRDAPLRRVVVVREIIDRMVTNEHRLLDQRRNTEQRSSIFLKGVLGGAALLMVLAAVATILLARRYIADLAYARDRLSVLNRDLEGEVERRTADVLRANEEIQRFAYIVSHDLRSPLVNILGFTAELEATNQVLGSLISAAEKVAPKLLTDEVRDAQSDLPEAIGFIRSSTHKMDRLINAILRLSREGRRTLAPELLPMDRVIEDIAASFARQVEETGAKLTIHKPLPDITNDRVAIEQIFSNLIENALKYRDPSRPAEITVRGNGEDGRAIFEVEDNGRGIDPKDHQRIFDLFRRSGAQDQNGEGIGLAQVRALVNRLGGYIDLESKLGFGSVFRLNLPITYVDYGAGNE